MLGAVALALRVFSWERTVVLFNDGPRFLRQAQALLDGRFGDALREPYHPLYAVLTALLSSLGLEPETAAAWVSILAGTGAVIVLFAFLRGAFGAPYDWLGAFLFATHSRAVEFTSDVQSEGLFFLLFLAAVALVWRGLAGGSWRWASLAGFVAGLAYWTRPEGLLVAGVAGLFALALGATRRWPTVLVLRFGTALALGAAVPVGAYAGAVAFATGEWTVTQKKDVPSLQVEPGEFARDTAVAGESAGAEETAEGSERAIPPPLHTVNPRQPKALGPALTDLWYTFRSGARPLLLAGFVFALVPFRGRAGGRAAFLVGLALVYAALLLWLLLTAGYVSRRHVLAPLLPLMGYAAVGLCTLWGFLQRVCPRPSLFRVATPLALVAMLLLPVETEPRRIDKLAERRAAEWVATQPTAHPSEIVAGVGGRVGYYARRAMVDLREVEPHALPATILAQGARFAVVDDPDAIRALDDSQDFVVRYRVQAGGGEAGVFEARPAGRP